jgi:hypothetical protein
MAKKNEAEPEDENEFEPDELDPVEKARIEKIQEEEMVKRIKKVANMEDDEINTLLPTLQKKKEFLQEYLYLRQHPNDEHLELDESGQPPKDDDDDLTPDQQRRVRELRGKKGKKKAEAIFSQASKISKDETPVKEEHVQDLQSLLNELSDED